MKVEATAEQSVRYHHYLFVQKVLFDYIKQRPLQSLEMFASANNSFFALKQLKSLWYQTIKQFPFIQKIDYEGLPISVIDVDDATTIVIITFPEAQATTESHHVAIAYQFSDKNKEPDTRYFTNEFHEQDESALCELNQNLHTCHGVTERLSKEEFADMVKNIIS